MTEGYHDSPAPSGPRHRRPDIARLSRDALGAQEVLARAVRRSGEEARDVRESAQETPGGAYLARSQWFLWAWATLAAGAAPPLLAPFPFPAAPSPRTLVLGTVASDLNGG